MCHSWRINSFTLKENREFSLLNLFSVMVAIVTNDLEIV